MKIISSMRTINGLSSINWSNSITELGTVPRILSKHIYEIQSSERVLTNTASLWRALLSENRLLPENRYDAFLIYLPMIVRILWRHRMKVTGVALIRPINDVRFAKLVRLCREDLKRKLLTLFYFSYAVSLSIRHEFLNANVKLFVKVHFLCFDDTKFKYYYIMKLHTWASFAMYLSHCNYINKFRYTGNCC